MNNPKGESNEINLGAGAQAQQVAAGSNISQTYIAQQIVNAPEPPREWNPPKQMLNVVPTFVGRHDALQDLATLGAWGATAPRFLLAGIGGFGKTSLAAQITYDLEHVFEGGILLAEIPTVDVFLKLDEWAKLYDEDVKEIQDLNLRADRVREIIHQRVGKKRVLAVLDGVVDENDDAKLEPLLRALSDCAVLVTTRNKYLASLYHFREIFVENFDKQDAVALFQRVLPNDKRFAGNEAQIHALGAAVDWLPFALDLLAKQLDKHREWTLTNLQTKLVESKLELLKWGSVNEKEKGIFASFLLSHNGLSEQEKTFFNTLGAFGGSDFDIAAAAFVAGKQGDTETGNAEKMLEHLLELSMVQTGRAMGRYRLHALMREFARTLCGANAIRANAIRANPIRENSIRENLYDADLRMATYYYDICKRADNDLKGERGENAKNIFESELTNIRASVTWARSLPNDETLKLLRGFAYETDNYLEFRGAWDERLEWLELGLYAAKQLNDEYGVGAMLNRLGLVYKAKGEWDTAIELYQKSLETLERVGDGHGMAQTFGNLGNVYLQKGEWDRAIGFYQKSLETKERVGDVHGMAQTYVGLGLVYADKGEWDKAIEFYQKSSNTTEQIGDVITSANNYWGLGIVYEKQNDFVRAFGWCNRAMMIWEKIESPHAKTYRAHLEELKNKTID